MSKNFGIVLAALLLIGLGSKVAGVKELPADYETWVIWMLAIYVVVGMIWIKRKEWGPRLKNRFTQQTTDKNRD